ncbi:hypothetical protein CK203_050750 [Vitis vinifera]|uniref:Uncharacterized protein n=1 Tax=Vitis vinifera TaxID=29760 RepID=A0A438HCH8_VITVI|nr:hypothetical protein CK203_050750 [Vitis vinifera]
MELVGGLFRTSKSPSHGSTSSAPTDRAGRAFDRDYTPAPASPASAPPVPMPEATSATPLWLLLFHQFLLLHLSLPSPYLLPIFRSRSRQTTDAIASDEPQDEPQTVDIVTATPDDASSLPEAATN